MYQHTDSIVEMVIQALGWLDGLAKSDSTGSVQRTTSHQSTRSWLLKGIYTNTTEFSYAEHSMDSFEDSSQHKTFITLEYFYNQLLHKLSCKDALPKVNTQ